MIAWNSRRTPQQTPAYALPPRLIYCNAFLLRKDVDSSYCHRLWLEGQAARNSGRHTWRRELQTGTGRAPSCFCTSKPNCLISSQRISNQWHIKLVRRLTNVWHTSEILVFEGAQSDSDYEERTGRNWSDQDANGEPLSSDYVKLAAEGYKSIGLKIASFI